MVCISEYVYWTYVSMSVSQEWDNMFASVCILWPRDCPFICHTNKTKTTSQGVKHSRFRTAHCFKSAVVFHTLIRTWTKAHFRRDNANLSITICMVCWWTLNYLWSWLRSSVDWLGFIGWWSNNKIDSGKDVKKSIASHTFILTLLPNKHSYLHIPYISNDMLWVTDTCGRVASVLSVPYSLLPRVIKKGHWYEGKYYSECSCPLVNDWLTKLGKTTITTRAVTIICERTKICFPYFLLAQNIIDSD